MPFGFFVTQGMVGVTQTVTENGRVDAALANLIVVLADNKYFLGRRMSEWAVGAPTLEGAVACAAIAQEEMGHTRPLYSFLEQLELSNPPLPLERDDDRERKYCLSFLRSRFPSWPFAVAALYLTDSALTIMLRGLGNADLGVLRRRADRIVSDEPTHAEFAAGRVRDLASSTANDALAASVRDLLAETLCWFGPEGEEGLDALKRAGLVELDNEHLRQAFLQSVMPLLVELDVRVDVGWNAGDEIWEYGGLPWERWNGLERCLETTTGTTA